MQEARDFKAECDAVAEVIADLPDSAFDERTQFLDWTIGDVVGHLYVWNIAAGLTLQSRDLFKTFIDYIFSNYGTSGSSLEVQYKYIDAFLGGARGKALFNLWCEDYPRLAADFEGADPERRVAWAGPDMSARSKVIARQMETWAHGQEVFDVLGLDRSDGDRIKNIAHLGVTTYSWTFRNREIVPPQPKPYVRLTAPSGAMWEWNEPQEQNYLEGAATEFCQVVTQTRNIADTQLKVVGEQASAWMAVAQCFAGAPKDPPAKGLRHKAIQTVSR